MLLKVGRHIRPHPNFKLIIGREDGENKFLQGYKNSYTSIKMISCSGPLTLIDGVTNDADLEFAARITARFSQGKNEDSVTVETQRANGETKTMDIKPLPISEMQHVVCSVQCR